MGVPARAHFQAIVAQNAANLCRKPGSIEKKAAILIVGARQLRVARKLSLQCLS